MHMLEILVKRFCLPEISLLTLFIPPVLQKYRNATFQLILASDSRRDRSYVMMIYDKLNLDADLNAQGLNIPNWLVLNFYTSGTDGSTELDTLPSNTGWYYASDCKWGQKITVFKALM